MGTFAVSPARTSVSSEPRKERTIVEAIEMVLRNRKAPMTVREIYDAIMADGLYTFKADNPVNIVQSQIRRHCLGVDFTTASKHKVFKVAGNGYYDVLETPLVKTPAPAKKLIEKSRAPHGFATFKKQYELYLSDFKTRVLDQLKKLTAEQFEHFCKNLLDAYGFRSLKVTEYSKDGGIDGYGQLKVGFDYFNVAFQCKRWRKGNVGRREISQFRGDIQGMYEQGVFFTTSRFTPEAKGYSLRRGAVPITLIDGPTIVDIMLEKGFGVERQEWPVYSLALDLAFSE